MRTRGAWLIRGVTIPGRCARDVGGTGCSAQRGEEGEGWRVLGRWADQGGRSPAAGLDELGSRVCGGLRWEGAETAHTGSSDQPVLNGQWQQAGAKEVAEGLWRRHRAGSTCAGVWQRRF